MDIELEYGNIKSLKKCQNISVEHSAQGELCAPEYMPEILRIVKSEATVNIDSCRAVGNRVTVDGVCEMRTVYTCDDGGIYTLSCTESFSKHCENEIFDGACDVTAKAGVSFVTCRATSNRRAEIKCGFLLTFTAWREQDERFVCCGKDDMLEKKSVPVVASSLGCKSTRRFAMSDTVAFTTPACFLLNSRATAVCTEVRKINSKIMIKGDVNIEIAYVPTADKMHVEHLRHTLPLNQILEFDGMEERFDGDVSLRVMSCDAMLRSDGDGVCRSADLSLGLCATASMWEPKECCAVTDAYSVRGNAELTKKRVAFYSTAGEFKETLALTSKLTLTGENLEVLDIVPELSEPEITVQNGNAAASGSVKYSLLVRSDGTLTGVEKLADYSVSAKCEGAFDSLISYPTVTVSGTEWAVNSDGTVDVRSELNIYGAVFSEYYIDTVTEVRLSESPVNKNRSAVTVYFPEKEESLWNIARRYNTTVGAVAAENALEGETTGNLKVLFIPSV